MAWRELLTQTDQKLLSMASTLDRSTYCVLIPLRHSVAGAGWPPAQIGEREQSCQFAAIIRGHRGIEDRLHWLRDIAFDEDRPQIRTASGPRIMSSPRNLVISVLRLSGLTSTTVALRCHARRPSRPIQMITKR